MHEREARLRKAYEAWYPEVRPDMWLPAELVAHAVRRQLETREPRWQPCARMLDQEHFDFRGGKGGRSRMTRSRRGD